MNLTFYPGPSQLYPQVEDYLRDACRSGILSMNHRSGAFMDMMARTMADLHTKLALPAGYEIYFTSSATECWEIVSQSLVAKSSLHAYNGAFGQKWFEYAERLHPAFSHSFALNGELDVETSAYYLRADVLCLTHNETSNGTAIPAASLRQIRSTYQGLIAVDATSSMGGVALPWETGDVWLASVQKCFGLPPGLGVLIVSPQAIRQAEVLGERAHYNSLLFVRDNFAKHQTPYTPNTLAIYLLGRVMRQVPGIQSVATELTKRAQELYTFFENFSLQPLVTNPLVRSSTVLALRGEESEIKRWKEEATQQGLLLGNGYGEWKGTSLRVANFPALTETDISRLMNFFQKQP